MHAEATLELCLDGSEHEPVIETDELTTEFWGALQTTIKITITCAKCGEHCRPRHEEPYEEPCSN